MAVHFDKDRMAEVCDNHERWWKGELGRPLVFGQIGYAYPPSHKAEAPLISQANCTDFSWSAEQVIDAIDSQLSEIEFIGDGFPYVEFNVFGPGVVAAFCGAILDNSLGAVWFSPREKKEIGDIHIKYDPDNIWTKRIKDIYRAGLQCWDGKVVMGMTDLGGILDIATTMCGTEELLCAMYDEPDEVKRVLGEIQTAWYEAYEDLNEVLKPQGYYADWSRLLSKVPNYSYTLQSDASYMISTPMFEEFVLDNLREDTRRLTYSVCHVDGLGTLKHLDTILTLKDLNAIQWEYGVNQPGPMSWLDVYRKIQKAEKQMVIYGAPEEVLGVIKELHCCPHTHIWYDKHHREDALDFLKMTEKYSKMK